MKHCLSEPVSPRAARRTMIGRTLSIAAMLIVFASAAEAQTAARKFGRGLAGMTTSVLEVPGNMVAQSNKRGAAEGIPLGFVIGLGMIVPRTLVGVYEFLTAPFPAPAGFRPILRPEFPWGYFEGERGSFGAAPAHTRVASR